MTIVKTHQLEALKSLALAGALKGHIDLTTSKLGKLMGVSQQTASNRIRELLDLGMVARETGFRAQRIRITDQGVAALRKEYMDFKRIFESYDKMSISGEVTTGSGEGRYYLQQEEYSNQFRRILRATPFKGTLNLKVKGREAEKLESLKSMDGIIVQGFESEGRAFGDVKCFLATIRQKKCAVVIPIRSHHREMVEIISHLKLRDAFKLRDGDLIAVDIDLVAKA